MEVGAKIAGEDSSALVRLYFRDGVSPCSISLRLDLQPMNREMVPMSEILVSDERENGWVIERGTMQISPGACLSQHRVISPPRWPHNT